MRGNVNEGLYTVVTCPLCSLVLCYELPALPVCVCVFGEFSVLSDILLLVRSHRSIGRDQLVRMGRNWHARIKTEREKYTFDQKR